ncbi:MAG: hypothetical protein J5959_05185, partial [Butyrivibrio sp.]|nr:hypothetical protein [Butyrivibrio sp.]
VDEKKWTGELIASVTGNAGTIAITSGVKDINTIGKLLEKLENDKKVSSQYMPAVTFTVKKRYVYLTMQGAQNLMKKVFTPS